MSQTLMPLSRHSLAQIMLLCGGCICHDIFLYNFAYIFREVDNFILKIFDFLTQFHLNDVTECDAFMVITLVT